MSLDLSKTGPSEQNIQNAVVTESTATPGKAGFAVVNPDGSNVGGGAATVADGADVAEGAKADAAYTSGSGSVISILKGIFTKLAGTIAAAITGTNLEVSFTTSTVQAVASTDAANYRAVSVHITSQGTGSTVTFQVSNDNVNWLPHTLTGIIGGTQSNQSSSTGSAGVIYAGMLPARYFRLNVTGISAGNTAGVVEFSSLPNPLGSMTVTNPSGQNIGTTAAQSGTWTTVQTPATSGGLTPFHLVAAATTNATNVKASAGQLYGFQIYNSNAAARKVAFHNTAGTPTAGASVLFSVVVPPNSSVQGFTDSGVAFGTGIGITTTTGLADSDATAVAANDLIINLFHK